MKDVILKTNTCESVIHCGSGTFEKYAPVGGRVFIVTDSNVYSLYRDLIGKTYPDAQVKVIRAGEKSKTLKTLTSILNAMTKAGVKRSDRVIAFGGGVVGDIAGLAASLYMRGVRLLQIPTTLLAQVDSSVGGKTAVDFKNVKNLIGAFYQPEEVIADPLFLRTLPEREINCGLGEIIKYAALDGDIYKTLLKNKDNLKDLHFLEGITCDCIGHKAKVVYKDEHDLLGVRKTLNLGHTTGHAFELFYGKKSHGEYVLIGTYYELYIASKLGLCEREYANSLIELITSVIGNVPYFNNVRKAAQLAKFDKKNEGGEITLVAPSEEGKSAEIKLSFSEYAAYLEECSEYLRKSNANS